MTRYLLMLLSTGLVLAACAQDEDREAIPEADPEPELGVNLDNLDRDVRPQDDLFRFVNGGWLERTEIPGDRSRWGAFDELNQEAEENLREIVEEVSEKEGVEEGSPEQMIRDFYLSFMDEDTVEEAGTEPIEDLLAEIADIDERDAIPGTLATLQKRNVTGPFSFFVSQDPQDSERYISMLTQSGLGLPDRDYYHDDGESAEQIRKAYEQHVARMLDLIDYDSPEEHAERIMAFETEVADSHWTRARNRDRVATYNLKTLDELRELAPAFDWDAYIGATGAEDIEEIVVRQPDHMTTAGEILEDMELDLLRAYLSWHVVRNYASLLSSEFDEAHFDFYSRTLQGVEEQRPRWERAINTLNTVVGFQLGKLYVERHFEEDAREQMAELVDNVTAAFEVTLRENPWMSDETREEALEKLSSFNTKIGHPDEGDWRDYDGLDIDASELVGNYMRSRAFEYERMIGRLGEEVDRGEWFMTPQTVNAYYAPSMNEIVFPAAILQPPFFDPDADQAVNYGGIGAVIGHEISHGFDDQGRQMDADGNLRDWWSEGSEEEFSDRAQVLIDQFSTYEPLEGMNIDGEVTQGENIADHGGLRVAHRAYRKALDGAEAPEIEGFTGDQRFFLGWGQVWRTLYRDEALQQHLQTAPHSPGEYRVNGTVVNMQSFYDAFDVSEGDDLYLPEAERADIW